MVTTPKTEEYLSVREEKIIVRNWKKEILFEIEKRKVKDWKVVKKIILDEEEPSVQSEDRTKAVKVWCWGNMYSPRPENWPYRSATVSENGGFHAGEDPSEATVLESNQIRELHETINF